MLQLKHPIGRPSLFTTELGDEICNRIADGKSLRAICDEADMPDKATVFRWLLAEQHKDFSNQYSRARAAQADSLVDDILSIADDARNDWMKRNGENATGYTPTHWRVGKRLAFGARLDSDGRMIRGGFLSKEDRKALIALARDGLAAGRVTRRATALVRLDEGLSCQEVAKVLLFDDDTIRDWYELFEQDGVEGLTRFEMGGSSGKISAEQCDALKAWVGSTLPRSTRQVGAWIAKEFGLVYESRSGLIALLHRLRLEYHKPEVMSRKLDPKTQKAFIASYENLMNSMGDDEVAMFVDAVHPTHAARPVGCWAPKGQKLAIEQTSGRERINIHGAIDLESGQTRMVEAESI